MTKIKNKMIMDLSPDEQKKLKILQIYLNLHGKLKKNTRTEAIRYFIGYFYNLIPDQFLEQIPENQRVL